MKKIFEEIKKERGKQDEKWGVQNHGPFKWGHILMEEVGEVSKAIIENCDVGTVITFARIHRSRGKAEITPLGDNVEHILREELIQVGAVVVAWLECIDRRTR